MSFKDAGFFHYPEAPLPTWWTQLPIRAPLLVGWAGGPRVDRVRSPSVSEGLLPEGSRQKAKGSKQNEVDVSAQFILAQAIDSLARIFNLSSSEVSAQLKASYIHDWHSDPFSLGAYSYLPVNGLETQQVLAQSLDNKLFFAGEATSVGHIGTVHGAIQSGERTAREILKIRE